MFTNCFLQHLRGNVSQPHFWKSVKMTLTFPKWGLGSPPRLPKLQSLIAGVKKPCLEAFFMTLEIYWNVDVKNGLTWAIWTSVAQVMAKRRVGSQLDLDVCRWSVTHRWKALKESYKFSLDLIPIKGLNIELWIHKVPRIQTRTISRLLLGSFGTKSHSNVGATE